MLSIVSKDKDVQRSSEETTSAETPDLQAAAPAAGSEATQEKRGSPRRPASAIPSIESVRISPHRAEAILINISARGVLVECGMRLQPGTRVTVLFSGSFTPSSVPSRVARSVVSGMAAEGIRYQVGIAFNQPIELPELSKEAATAEPVAATSAESGTAESPAAVEPPRKPPVNRW